MFDRFMLGVNYWPRHHAVKMWQEWAPDEIDAEFKQMRDIGLDTVRIFLTWDDFQPLLEKGTGGGTREIVMRHDESVTPVECPEMIDQRMVARFDEVLAIAARHDLKLIVPLMTGWMSGVLLDVSWRKNRSVWTDPFMLKWQLLYCRYFARRYRDNETILAWEFGNEHNCFMPCPTPEAAWSWMKTITNQLRIEDPNHPVFSGMHSLTPFPQPDARVWGIGDSAESCDVLTVHPYPIFTKGCFLDRVTDMRANMHASAESRFYQGLGQRPVLCEETGSLGNSFMSDERAADFLRLRLYSLLANNDLGCLWWCYSDFTRKEMIPYKWNQMESDGLGITDTAGTVKPTGLEYSKFRQVVDKVGGRLPTTPRRAAIVIMNKQRESLWPLYFNTFVLCKQAGLEADFVFPTDDLDRYKLLICPSLITIRNYDVKSWRGIVEHTRKGGVLYVSSDGASLPDLTETFGIELLEKRPNPEGPNPILSATGCPAVLKGFEYSPIVPPEWRLEVECRRARALLQTADGIPALTEFKCGTGTALHLTVPIETIMSQTKYALEDNPFYRLYDYLKGGSGTGQPLDIGEPLVERTYHRVSDSEGFWVLVNYQECEVRARVSTDLAVESIEPLTAPAQGSAKQMGTDWEVTVAPLQGAIYRVTFGADM